MQPDGVARTKEEGFGLPFLFVIWWPRWPTLAML